MVERPKSGARADSARGRKFVGQGLAQEPREGHDGHIYDMRYCRCDFSSRGKADDTISSRPSLNLDPYAGSLF